MVGNKSWRVEHDRQASTVPPLPLARVKSIAQNDESVGKMGVDATSLIARCADAFLADLVTEAVERARAAGNRKPAKSGGRNRSAASKAVAQQVIVEDVRKAVAEEERFDFLRPVLSPPEESGTPLGVGGAKGKRKSSGQSSGGSGAGRGGARTVKARTDVEPPTSAGRGAASAPDPRSRGGAKAVAEAGPGGLLALAGLDEEGRRRALLGTSDAKASAPFGLGDEDDDEDYDNC